METWDIASLDVEPHQPEVLRSDPEARVIAINLPAGDELQDIAFTFSAAISSSARTPGCEPVFAK